MDLASEGTNTSSKDDIPDQEGKNAECGQNNVHNLVSHYNSKDKDANGTDSTRPGDASPQLINTYKISKSTSDLRGNTSTSCLSKLEHNRQSFLDSAKRSDKQDNEQASNKIERDEKDQLEESEGKKEEIKNLTNRDNGEIKNGANSPADHNTDMGKKTTGYDTEDGEISETRGVNVSYPEKCDEEIEQKNDVHLQNIPNIPCYNAVLEKSANKNVNQMEQTVDKGFIAGNSSYYYSNEALTASSSSGDSSFLYKIGGCGTCAAMVQSSVKLFQKADELNRVIQQKDNKLREVWDIVYNLNHDNEKLTKEKNELLRDVVHLNNSMQKISNKNEVDHSRLKYRLAELQQHLDSSHFLNFFKRSKDIDQNQIFDELFQHLLDSRSEIKAKDSKIAELKDKFDRKTKEQREILADTDKANKRLTQRCNELSQKEVQFLKKIDIFQKKLSNNERELNKFRGACRNHVTTAELRKREDDLNSKLKDKEDMINYLKTEQKEIYEVLSKEKGIRIDLEARLQKMAEVENIVSNERRLFTKKLEKMKQYMEAFRQPITIDQVQRDTEAKFIKNSLEKIRQVEAKARQYKDKIINFYGNSESKAYLDIKEKLSRAITDELDTIESQGNTDIQNKRREVIVYIQSLKQNLEMKVKQGC